MTMHVSVIHNPASGRRRVSGEQLRASIRAGGHTLASYSTEISDWALDRDVEADVVVIAGGDGTVRRILPRLADSGRAATIVPLGTANNVAKSLGIDVGHPLSAIEHWQTASLQRFDLPLVSLSNRHLRLVEGAGVGLFCRFLAVSDAITRAVNTDLNLLEAVALLRVLVKRSVPQYYNVVCDDRNLSGEYIAVEAMNISHVGPRVPIASRADASDQRLEIVLLEADHRTALLDHLEQRARGGGLELLEARSVPARRVKIRLPMKAWVRADDRRYQFKSRLPRLEVAMDGTQVNLLTSRTEAAASNGHRS